jgi:hypothetical protein
LLPDTERKPHSEKHVIQKIVEFKWNEGNNDPHTIQEIVMQEITNDAGEYLMSA